MPDCAALKIKAAYPLAVLFCVNNCKNWGFNMKMQDRMTLCNWKNCTLSEVDGFSQFGLVENERFTPRAKRTFKLLHTWCAFRFSSSAQDKHYALHGMDGLNRRMVRANKLAAAIWGTK